MLDSVLSVGKKHLINKIHCNSLEKIEQRIIEDNYPDKLAPPLRWADSFQQFPGEDGKDKSKQGNPNFEKIKMPEGFYDKAEELIAQKYPKLTQEGIAYELIKYFFDGDKSKKNTVLRRIMIKNFFDKITINHYLDVIITIIYNLFIIVIIQFLLGFISNT